MLDTSGQKWLTSTGAGTRYGNNLPGAAQPSILAVEDPAWGSAKEMDGHEPVAVVWGLQPLYLSRAALLDGIPMSVLQPGLTFLSKVPRA